MSRRPWYGPTDGAWIVIVALTVAGWAMGGWGGAALMAGFFLTVNVLGNVGGL